MARTGKSKPHIKIGSYYFMLDESVDAGTTVGSLYRPHYRWSIDSYLSPTTNFNNQSEQNALFMDDFAGGEGNRNWFPDDPTVYDFAYGLNPRIRGQLTARPSRSRDSITGTKSTASEFAYFAVAGGALWFAGGCDVLQLDQSDPVNGTWTSYTSGLALPTDSTYTAVAGDSHRLLLGSSITGNTTFKILAANVSNFRTITNGALPGMVCELTSMHGFVYALEYDLSAAVRLYRYDVSAGYDYNATTNPIAKKQVSNPIPMDTAMSTYSNFKSFTDTQSWYTGIAPSQNSVFFFVSTQGYSRLWEYKQRDATYPRWTAPDGFTIRDIEYSNGYVFIVGHWGPNSSNSGYGSLYVYESDSGNTVFVADVGRSRQVNAILSTVTSTHAAQALFCDGVAGRIWTYDADEDGVSMLDTIATVAGQGDKDVSGSQGGSGVNTTASFTFDTTETNYITDMLTWGGIRYVAINDTGAAAFQVLRYQNDEPTNRQQGTATGSSTSSLTTGLTDFGIPFEQKYLAGIYVSWRIDPGTSWTTGQSIIVEYDLDGAGFVSAGTIDSTHADKNKGSTFLAIASPPTFTALRIRVTLTGTNGVSPPILLGFTPKAYQQSLELLVALKNPVGNTRRGPAGTNMSAWQQRAFLKAIATAGNKVTVVDNYANPVPGQSNTYTMVVDNAEDIIMRDGEGTMHVMLRTV